MTTKTCAACNGTGKAVEQILPNGSAVLKGCVPCNGTGVAVKVKKPKKGPTLPDPGTGVVGVMKQVGGAVASNALDAAKEKLAKDAMQVMVAGGRQLAESFGYQLDAKLDPVIGAGMSLLLMLGTGFLGAQEDTMIPRGMLEAVNAASSHALKGLEREKVEQVMAQAMPVMGKLLQVGGTLLQLQGGSGQAALVQGNVDEETKP